MTRDAHSVRSFAYTRKRAGHFRLVIAVTTTAPGGYLVVGIHSSHPWTTQPRMGAAFAETYQRHMSVTGSYGLPPGRPCRLEGPATWKT